MEIVQKKTKEGFLFLFLVLGSSTELNSPLLIIMLFYDFEQLQQLFVGPMTFTRGSGLLHQTSDKGLIYLFGKYLFLK